MSFKSFTSAPEKNSFVLKRLSNCMFAFALKLRSWKVTMFFGTCISLDVASGGFCWFSVHFLDWGYVDDSLSSILSRMAAREGVWFESNWAPVARDYLLESCDWVYLYCYVLGVWYIWDNVYCYRRWHISNVIVKHWFIMCETSGLKGEVLNCSGNSNIMSSPITVKALLFLK